MELPIRQQKEAAGEGYRQWKQGNSVCTDQCCQLWSKQCNGRSGGKIEAINQADRESVAKHNNEIDKTNASAYNDISKQNATNYLNHLAYIDKALNGNETDTGSDISYCESCQHIQLCKRSWLDRQGRGKMFMNMINSDSTKYFMIKPDGGVVYANEYFGLNPQEQAVVDKAANQASQDKIDQAKKTADESDAQENARREANTNRDLKRLGLHKDENGNIVRY